MGASTKTEKETHVVKKVIKKLIHKNKILKTHHVNNKIGLTKTEKETHVVKKLMIPLQTKQTETKKVNHVNTQIKTHHENNKIASNTTKKRNSRSKKSNKKID